MHGRIGTMIRWKTKGKAVIAAALAILVNVAPICVFAESSGTAYDEYISAYSEENYSDADFTVDALEKENEKLSFTATVPVSGVYSFGMSYKTDKNIRDNISLSLSIDGKIPFNGADALELPRIWKISSDVRTDGLGNEFAAESSPCDEYRFGTARLVTNTKSQDVLLFLEKGNHSFSVGFTGDIIPEVNYVSFSAPEKTEKYSEKSVKKDSGKESVVLEGEKATETSSKLINPKSDGMSSRVSPHDFKKAVLNYIGGDNWKTVGDSITWTTPEMKAGYYKIDFYYRQATQIGSNTYRSLRIDGKTPFEEAENISFAYCSDWENITYSNEDGNPYYIYLTEGTHEISLTVTMGSVAQVCDTLKTAVSEIGNLYIDMTVITGKTVDIYRDYDLFNQIPDMAKRLKKIRKLLNTAAKELNVSTGNKSSTNSSVIKNMQRVVEDMLNNKYSAQRYVSNYYSYYCSLAEIMNTMKEMPLDIDKIVLSPPKKQAGGSSGFAEKLGFSVGKLFSSFVTDYKNVSKTTDSKENLTVWVNWGRDQAQVLNTLLQTSFTPKYSVNVDIRVVNASAVQAVLSGDGPDCFLQHSRSEPVNLAMRGVLYNLEEFSDLEDVLKRFQDGAEIPYRYKNGLYALPDTQNFYIMFYRKDILDKLGIEIPETWYDFEKAYKVLAKNNLEAWIPYVQITDMNQVNSGIGSLSIFPSLLLQNGLSLYTDDHRSTTLTKTETMDVFTNWTKWYSQLKLPVTINFYNRFRTGICPLGIEIYTQYNTLKAAATEIDGLWGVAPIPGTVRDDKTVSHTSTGGGTACFIFKNSKNPEMAWELLKWWTDGETQAAYSNNIETVLGPTGRIAVANKAAWNNLSWDKKDKPMLLKAWGETEEIPEIPGSYYVSRAIDHSFWNVVNNNKNPKDMLLEWGKEVDDEITRKRTQYENR